MSAQNPATPPQTEQMTTPERKRSGTVATGVAIAIAVVLLIVGIGGGYYAGTLTKSSTSTTTITLTETGSSLLYPLFDKYWDPNYTAAVISPDSTGSGTGQSNAELALVNIGASDGYLKNASQTSLINLPVAISAQLVYYNLPGLPISDHLNLNGTDLAMIYAGVITTWSNPLIVNAQNATIQTYLKGVTSPIVPLKRADSSGDTFLFTSLCYMSWSGWTYSYSTSALSGTSWTGETGNSGMVAGLLATQYSIGYVGISYESSASSLGYAALGTNESLSAAGGVNSANYVLPSATTISEDANLGLTHLQYSQYQLAVSLIMGGSPYGAINLTLGGGGTNPTTTYPNPYPDANLEYTLIKTAPVAGSKVVTSTNLAATVAFLQWAISYGNFASTGGPSPYISGVNFVPLTPEVIGYDQQELASVIP